MYISRRNTGWQKLAVVFGIIVIIISLTSCVLLFMKVKELEAEVQGLSEFKSEYLALSDKADAYFEKCEEYFEKMDAYFKEAGADGSLDDTISGQLPASDNTGDESADNDDYAEPQDSDNAAAGTAAGGDDDESTKAAVTADVKRPDNIEETEGKGKKVYLTFDDGPSSNTDEILDILKSYGVKATFFVNAKNEELYADYYRRIVEEGHTLAMHSYNHVYADVYASVDAFMADTMRLRDYIYGLTGVTADIYRFPGGSSNTITDIDILEFARALSEEGIVYFDWNVSSGDASSVVRSSDEIFERVISGVRSKSVPVVLMHDLKSKTTTVEALPEILEYLVVNGYDVAALDSSVTPVQHVRLDK